jgi:ABC-2 type transport system permease protein
MNAALSTEWLKSCGARTPRIVTGILIGGIVAMSAGMFAAPEQDNAALSMKLSIFVSEKDWAGLSALASVVMASGGLVAFGILLAWMFGREFVDRAAPGLFGLPTSMNAIASAKIVLYLCWLLGIAIAIPALLVPAGLAVGLGTPDASVLAPLAKLALVTILTGLLAFPAAWIATMSRGYLAPIGTILAIVIVAQISVLTPAGVWFPFAIPGIWAGLAGTESDLTIQPLQLFLTIPVGSCFAIMSVVTWRKLRL